MTAQTMVTAPRTSFVRRRSVSTKRRTGKAVSLICSAKQAGATIRYHKNVRARKTTERAADTAINASQAIVKCAGRRGIKG